MTHNQEHALARTRRIDGTNYRCGDRVHRALGPGLLESVYEECPCFDLRQAGIPHARQVPLPLIYKDVRLDCTYHMDIIVEQTLVLEIKAVDASTLSTKPSS